LSYQLLKKRNLKDFENYRGICVLNGGYKTFIGTINSKLEAHHRDIFGQQQNGFSQGQILG
jgi:hypothetical protein